MATIILFFFLPSFTLSLSYSFSRFPFAQAFLFRYAFMHMEWKECMIFLCEAYRNEVPHHRRCNIASPHRCLFLCCSQCSLRSRTYRIHKCGSKAASSYIQKFICVDKKKNHYEATAVLCNLHHCTICTNGRFSIAFIIRYTWIRYTMKQITMLYTQYSSHSYSHVN